MFPEQHDSPRRSSPRRGPLSQLPPLASTASYLSAVHEADVCARIHGITPTSKTPALSMSSSISSSGDTVLNESDDNSGLIYPCSPHIEAGLQHHPLRVWSLHQLELSLSPNITQKPVLEHEVDELPYYILFTTYFNYLILIIFRHLHNFFGKRFAKSYFTHLMPHDLCWFLFCRVTWPDIPE